jgi:hypothetical protein
MSLNSSVAASLGRMNMRKEQWHVEYFVTMVEHFNVSFACLIYNSNREDIGKKYNYFNI